MSKRYVPLKINPEDTDRPENEEARRKYGITAFPAIAFLSSEGDLIHLSRGFLPPEQFVSVMEGPLKEEAAFQHLKAELKKSPKDPKVNAELANTYLKWDNLEKGQHLADKALKLDPDNKTGLLPEIHLNLGVNYGNHPERENNEMYFQKAETHFKTIIQKYPQSRAYETAQLFLGMTYVYQEKYELAINALEKLNDAKDDVLREQAATLLASVKREAELSK